MILAIIAQILIGIAKAISDITDHSDNWNKSIFSGRSHYHFLGAKDKTWTRKYSLNAKYTTSLFSTLLVSFTDIWHTANTLRYLAWLGFALSVDGLPLWAVIVIWSTNRIVFHVCYTWLLRKDFWSKMSSIVRKKGK